MERGGGQPPPPFHRAVPLGKMSDNVWWPLQGGPRTQLVADCTHGRGHLDWKRGEVVPRTKVAITLETKPGNKPGTNKLESRLGTGARPQGTATCRPHASISKLAHLGGGWGLGAGVLVGCTGQRSACAAEQSAQPSKEACGGCREQLNQRTTSPRFQ